MSEIINLIKSQLGNSGIQQLSNLIGAGKQETEKGIDAALPTLLGAFGKQAQNKKQAGSLLSVLDRDHDGSILDDLVGFLDKADEKEGNSILGHTFGSQSQNATEGVSKFSGLGNIASGKLLSFLAPMVIGALGKKTRESGGLNLGALSGLLSNEQKSLNNQGGMVMKLASQFLDKDGDGSIIDDVAGGIFKRLFNKFKK